jgi:hypothetical protein
LGVLVVSSTFNEGLKRVASTAKGLGFQMVSGRVFIAFEAWLLE